MHTNANPQRTTLKLSTWQFGAISCLLVALPFAWVSFPPSTDLPQHMSQIHLLLEVFRGEETLYAIGWYAPNNLIYLILGGAWFLVSPALSGKITLMILTLLWSGTAFFLVAQRQRPPETAILASLLIFNQSLYWGFFNFLIGWPIFVLWLTQSLQPLHKKRRLLLVLLSALLYASHALWFLLGSIWLLSLSVYQWSDWKTTLYRSLSLAPVGLASLVWYPQLVAARVNSGVNVAPYWFNTPCERLTPPYLVDSTFGGLQGPWEAGLMLAIAVWIALGIWSNIQNLKQKVDFPLVLCASMFFAMVLFAPDRYMNTISFANRWLPCGLILILVAIPPPKWHRHLNALVAICLLAAFSMKTTQIWHRFEQQELAGLATSLQYLPKNQRVIGLDFIKRSKYLKGRPFLQTFAYAQALKGGKLNFSFAEHASSIVRYKKPRNISWRSGLEWYAERARKADFLQFDYALIHANSRRHRALASRSYLKPVTRNGTWRLYRIIQS
jgi:hypothetical protein